jgi:hypothetical protein
MLPNRTCFIVMPIGGLEFGGEKISSSDLKNRYDDLIKEALLRADPHLEITRSDDVAVPGTITTDILNRIMHSDLVVADVTYPNPNVFYELGLRHACRVGTIIIRDKNGPRAPFDIAHLRHIEYDNTPTGLKDLADNLKLVLDHFSRNPASPDCHFQELAKLTQYCFPDYIDRSKEIEPETAAIIAMMQSPEILSIVLRTGNGEAVNQAELITAMASNPIVMGSFARAMVKSGGFSSPTPQSHKTNTSKKLGTKKQVKGKQN